MTKLRQWLVGAAAIVLVFAGAARADHHDQIRRRPAYRPYITEVGPPRTLSRREFDKQVVVNSDLKSWVQNYGYPDVAEIQQVVPQYGWSDYEVRIFYLDRNQELAFGRVSFFPTPLDFSIIDDYGLIKYQGRMQDENRRRVEYASRLCAPGGSPFDRILAAAERAERAATMAEQESQRALAAALRAEDVVGRMETGFRAGLRK